MSIVSLFSVEHLGGAVGGGWALSRHRGGVCTALAPCLTVLSDTNIALYPTLLSGFGLRTETDVHVDSSVYTGLCILGLKIMN